MAGEQQTNAERTPKNLGTLRQATEALGQKNKEILKEEKQHLDNAAAVQANLYSVVPPKPQKNS